MISLNRNHNLNRNLAFIFFIFCGLTAFPATNSTLALRYARLYEQELAGEHAGLVAGYRALFSDARESDKELAEKSLYRIGLCEKKAGRLEQARSVWRGLVNDFPLSDPFVASAREALKALEWEMDRIVISGKVGVYSGVTGVPPAGKCLVFAGEWGSEPPVVTGLDGSFRMGRRAAGQLPDGRTYGLIYAEEATRALVGADIWLGSAATGLVVSLAAPVTLVGWVVDHVGIPVSDARIRITGFVTSPVAGGGAEFGGVARTAYSVPLPLDRLLPPVFSGTNGVFTVQGLPAGLRYELTPETANYRVILKGNIEDFQGGKGAALGPAKNLTTQSLSNVLASVTWLRGNLETGAGFSWGDVQGRTVVFHFGSAYGEASLRAQYPDEGGALSRLMELFGHQGVLCLWVLPEGEARGEAAQLALGLYPEIPVGSGPWVAGYEPWVASSGQGWNVVLGREGHVLAVCLDQQVLRAVKKALE
jgi:hypothetical protein